LSRSVSTDSGRGPLSANLFCESIAGEGQRRFGHDDDIAEAACNPNSSIAIGAGGSAIECSVAADDIDGIEVAIPGDGQAEFLVLPFADQRIACLNGLSFDAAVGETLYPGAGFLLFFQRRAVFAFLEALPAGCLTTVPVALVDAPAPYGVTRRQIAFPETFTIGLRRQRQRGQDCECDRPHHRPLPQAPAMADRRLASVYHD
jgi:hypothetical protein